MSTRLTRRGWAVIVGGSILAGLGAGMATGDVCYWGRCSDRIPTPRAALTPPAAPLAERAVPSNLFGPILLATPPAAPQTPPASRARTAPRWSCPDPLARVLYAAGFRGDNLHEAWAIAMRESGGIAANVSNGVDHGLFQFNRPTWGDAPWWDTARLLTADYNAEIAYRISAGGTDWRMWGLTGDGQTDPSAYGRWSDTQVWAWITEPYRRWYAAYPC